MVSKTLKILIGVTVGVIVLAGIAVALYFTVFEGSVSKLEDAFTPSSPQPETKSPTYYSVKQLSIQELSDSDGNILETHKIATDETSNKSESQCQTFCNETTDCIAYRWTESDDGNQCYLFDAIPKLKHSSSSTVTSSGFSCDAFECTDSYVKVDAISIPTPYTGSISDGSSTSTTNGTLDECIDLCDADSDCTLAVRLNHPGLFTDGTCYLGSGIKSSSSWTNQEDTPNYTIAFKDGSTV